MNSSLVIVRRASIPHSIPCDGARVLDPKVIIPILRGIGASKYIHPATIETDHNTLTRIIHRSRPSVDAIRTERGKFAGH